MKNDRGSTPEPKRPTDNDAAAGIFSFIESSIIKQFDVN
jgi:hypothetical protein